MAYDLRISDWSADVCSSDLVIYPGCLYVTGRILVDRQSFEMCLSASDLCRFVVPQIIREQAALSFDDEIKAFLAIHLHENRPIGIVGDRKSTRLNSSH